MRWTALGMILGVFSALHLSGIITTGSLVLGQDELERRRRAGRPIKSIHFGEVRIEDDVLPALAPKVIWNLRVFGSLVAPKAVMANIPGRIKVTGETSIH